MRTHFLLILVAILIFGCARTGMIPTDPGFMDGSAAQSGASAPELTEVKEISEPHRLWGNGMIYISEDHSSAELVPNRRARVHLNALKFLEDQIPDDLKAEIDELAAKIISGELEDTGCISYPDSCPSGLY